MTDLALLGGSNGDADWPTVDDVAGHLSQRPIALGLIAEAYKAIPLRSARQGVCDNLHTQKHTDVSPK